MDVPDRKFHSTDRSSLDDGDGGVTVGHAASILPPGALMSGCKNR